MNERESESKNSTTSREIIHQPLTRIDGGGIDSALIDEVGSHGERVDNFIGRRGAIKQRVQRRRLQAATTHQVRHMRAENVKTSNGTPGVKQYC